jgi:hypothetical protein
VLGAAWGVGVGLVVTKRSAHGRFKCDPEKYRDAILKRLLHVAALVAGGALLVLVLFVAVAIGRAPMILAGGAFLLYPLARYTAARFRRSPAPADRAPQRRKPKPV